MKKLQDKITAAAAATVYRLYICTGGRAGGWMVEQVKEEKCRSGGVDHDGSSLWAPLPENLKLRLLLCR